MHDDPSNRSFSTPAARAAWEDVGLDGQVVVYELRRPRRIGEDSANRGGSDEHGLWPEFVEPRLDVRLPPEIHFVPADAQQLAVFGLEPPDQRRADHAPVAGDPDPLAGQGVGGGGLSGHRIPISRFKASRSARTISPTSSANVVWWCHPSAPWAFLGSPQRALTSVGRK